MILDEYFEEEPNPENGTASTIMCMGNHSNWVVSHTGVTGCKKVSILSFKMQVSQVFTLVYNSGRDNNADFWENAPEYWRKD